MTPNPHREAGALQTFAEEYLPSEIQETPEWQSVVESNLLLQSAAEHALNYIENTEGEFGIELPSGRLLRLALAKARGESA
jgi:hypothetical protein